jgi:hypothetical protein
MSNPAFLEGVPGIFEGLNEAVYRGAPGVNISNLKAMGKSPAHYLAKVEEPLSDPTDAQVFGTLLHLAVLEPDRLAGAYVTRPEGLKFTTKEGKAWKDSQTLPILDVEKSAALMRTAMAVSNHPTAGQILSGGRKEVSVFKTHGQTGLLLKGRIDCLTEDENGFVTVVDVKTTEDASIAGFSRAIASWQYHAQAAFYMDLVAADYFVFLAVEKSAPYAVGIYALDEASIGRGRDAYGNWLEMLARCQETGEWPGYSMEVETISLPAWAMKGQGHE